MKIENLNISKNFNKKLVACVLGGTLALTALTGCGSKNTNKQPWARRDNLLKGTMLENTCVVTFYGGTKDIAVPVEKCDDDSYRLNNYHFFSITSGEYYSSTLCKHDKVESEFNYLYYIEDVENITSYLTEEEIKKAAKGELTQDDVISITTRICTSSTEESNSDESVIPAVRKF